MIPLAQLEGELDSLLGAIDRGEKEAALTILPRLVPELTRLGRAVTAAN